MQDINDVNKEITERLNGTEYTGNANGLYLKAGKPDASENEHVANGVILVDRRIYYDKGFESTEELELRAIYGGACMETFKVSSEQLNSPEKFKAKLPTPYRPARKSGSMIKIVDSVKAQLLNCPLETVYAHTGWVLDDSRLLFLHAGGAIGTDETKTVEFKERLLQYRFPSESHPDRWEVFRELVNAAPKHVMLPLIAFAALSPLNYFLRKEGIEPAFLVYLYSKTGAGKSTLAALVLSLFGEFENKALPSSFKDTRNALVEKGAVLADVLTVIDDYHPEADRKKLPK